MNPEDYLVTHATLLASLIKAISAKQLLTPAEMGQVFDEAYISLAAYSPERAGVALTIFDDMTDGQFVAPGL